MPDTIYDLAAQLGQALLARRWRVTTAESCTGGGIASAITEVAGSSGWFDMGFVTYSNIAKHKLIGVDNHTLITHGAVSEAVAVEMAQGALVKAAAQLAVAVSGIAGPSGGTEAKPVGTVCFAWATLDGTHHETRHFTGDRRAVRQQTVIHALRGLLAEANRPPKETAIA
jgi:nicotinamide-nucleotide amidase